MVEVSMIHCFKHEDVSYEVKEELPWKRSCQCILKSVTLISILPSDADWCA